MEMVVGVRIAITPPFATNPKVARRKYLYSR